MLRPLRSSVVVKYNDAAYYTGLLHSIESVDHIYRPRLTLYFISTCYGVHGNIAYVCPNVHFLEGLEEILYVEFVQIGAQETTLFDTLLYINSSEMQSFHLTHDLVFLCSSSMIVQVAGLIPSI